MTEKLIKLRESVKKLKLDAYIEPVHDEWTAEYPPPAGRRIEWLTGFSGSAGLLIVTQEKAALFVDGRYTLQAQNQVGKEYEIHNSGEISPYKFLLKETPHTARVGYDPKLFTEQEINKFKPLSFAPVANLIEEFRDNRPTLPASEIFIHELKYTGESSASRCTRIAEEIKKQKADALFISSPENICRLLNIRARDTENTPLLLARAVIDAAGKVILFADPARFNDKLREHLGAEVEICPPENMPEKLAEFAGKTILFDPQNTNVLITSTCKAAGIELIDSEDPCTLLKAIKNPVELAGIRNAHTRDGVAVTKTLYWLNNNKNISELDVAEKILSFRKQNELFLEPSFDTIAGSGANGAIVHYRADEKSNRILQDGELFLLDSGGQYFDGTTDITRTIAIGTPNAEQKDRFTRVLKGHIALATAIFPEGTTGTQLDSFARQYLWQAGLDYDHGTGHGVGYFLSVHEGPQNIGKRANPTKLLPGMILSNEPGYYKTGEYGIRIENLVAVVEKFTSETGKKFFGFETLTVAPIDTGLIDFSMLNENEKLWIAEYHERVKNELSPYLSEDEMAWLELRV